MGVGRDPLLFHRAQRVLRKYLSSGTIPPSPEQEIGLHSAAQQGAGEAHCVQKRPRSPGVAVDPHGEGRVEIILHAAQTLNPAL